MGGSFEGRGRVFVGLSFFGAGLRKDLNGRTAGIARHLYDQFVDLLCICFLGHGL